MPKKERQAKQAAFAMNQELNSEMTEEERERMLKHGMGTGGGIDKGEDKLFGALLHCQRRLLLERLEPSVSCAACCAACCGQRARTIAHSSRWPGWLALLRRREEAEQGGEEGRGGTQEG